MNLDDILCPQLFSETNGHVISSEEILILYNSLLILQNENHFRKVFFWGKIFGVEKDYYIAFGYTRDVLHDRTYYYSQNCLDWGRLPKPTENAKKVTPFCVARFQGDPALVLDVLIESIDQPQVRKLKEEDRLSATVHLINFETSIVPRGAVFKRPDGVIVENLTFEGLSELEAREFLNYQHFRTPIRKWNTNLLTRDDYNFAIDFLDPLDVDIPEGCWVIQFAAGGTFVTLRSLYWPGMHFFHQIKTPKCGSLYFGNGKKSLDVPFLLNIDEYLQIVND